MPAREPQQQQHSDGARWRAFPSYDDLRALFATIPRLLRPAGRFSYFNGIASHTPLGYAVFSALAHCHLSAAGLSASFRAVAVDRTKEADVEQTGASYLYFTQPFYLLPIVSFRADAADADADAEPAFDTNGACQLQFERVFRTPPGQWLSLATARDSEP